MLTQKSLKAAAPPQFSHADMETIISVLANQPLQNLSAAQGLQALINRFAQFSAKHLGPKPAQAAPTAPAAPAARKATTK